MRMWTRRDDPGQANATDRPAPRRARAGSTRSAAVRRVRTLLVGVVAAAALATPGWLTASLQDAGAAPGIALVQQSAAATTLGATETVTLSSAPGAGHMLVLVWTNEADLVTVTSVSGGGVTWVKANQQNDNANTGDNEVWYGLNSSGAGTAITINLSGPATSLYSTAVLEFSGVPTAEPGVLDGKPAGTTGNGTTAVAPSITPAVGNELFVGLISTSQARTGSPPGGGFTAIPLAGPSTHNQAGFLIATDPAAHQMSQTTVSGLFAGTAASFEPAAAPAPPASAPATVVVTPRFTG
jgi:hypothetical protein